jgi:hypothetical protein
MNFCSDEALADSLLALPQSKLTHLTLSGSFFGRKSIHALGQALPRSSLLKLSLPDQIHCEDGNLLVAALTKANLTSLSLGNGGSNSSVIHNGILSALKAQTRLQALVLDGNGDASLLASNLSSSSLTSLSCAWTPLQDAETFASVLSKTKLTMLDFENNECSTSDALSLIRGLKNSAVRYLTLYDNPELLLSLVKRDRTKADRCWKRLQML